MHHDLSNLILIYYINVVEWEGFDFFFFSPSSLCIAAPAAWRPRPCLHLWKRAALHSEGVVLCHLGTLVAGEWRWLGRVMATRARRHFSISHGGSLSSKIKRPKSSLENLHKVRAVLLFGGIS